MPTLEDLRLRTGQVILEEWYDTLIDILEGMESRLVLDYYGFINKDLIPDTDLMLNLGSTEKRFKELHVGTIFSDYGYFSGDLYIGDKNIQTIAKEIASTYAFKGGYISNFLAPEIDLALNLGFMNKRWKEVHGGYGYFTYDVFVKDKTIEQLIEEKAVPTYWYGGAVTSDVYPDTDLALNLGFPDKRWKEIRAGWGYFTYGIIPTPTATWYGGQVSSDIYPETDLMLNLGYSNKRFKEIYGGYGYFSYDVFIKDKTVEQLIEEKAVPTYWYGGVVTSDIYPDTDLMLNIGYADKRFKEMHMGYGYADYGMYVAGKPVLKDGDPISISDIQDLAKTKITSAINESYVTSYTSPLHSDLQNIYNTLLNAGKPFLITTLINTSVSPLTDIFPSDLPISLAGRVRFKFTLNADAYTYVKWLPYGSTSAILSLLNAGDAIPANAWHEFDFTVNKDDKVNFQVDRSLTITIAVYNIPNA
jgi:hypothetical protein